MDKCPECGSGKDLLNWNHYGVNNSGVVGGRLTMHDVSFIYVLSCEYCGEELEKLSPDEVSLRLLTTTT